MLGFFRKLIRFRRYHLHLEPQQDLELDGDKWCAYSENACFRLVPHRSWTPKGWVMLSYRADTEEQALVPRLLWNGCEENQHNMPLTLARHFSGDIRHRFPLPSPTPELHLKPVARAGHFKLEEVRLYELGTLALAASLIWPRMKLILRHPTSILSLANRLLLTLREGGLGLLKARLLRTYRSANDYDEWITRFDDLSTSDKVLIQAAIDVMENKPLISVVMPVYNAPEQWLRLAVRSLQRQLYSNWELCIGEDCSSDPAVRPLIKELAREDKRIKYTFREENGRISAATNSALALASGEFVAFMDHDDELSEHALYYLAEEINAHPDAGLIYSDEDKMDETGRRYDAYFKPDWSYDLLLSQNYFNHLTAIRRSVIEEVGGLREAFNGSQDYDLVLRVIDKLEDSQIRHIPHILYHWRAIPGSTALSQDEKDYPFEAAQEAIREHLKRREIQATVTKAPGVPYHRVLYELPEDLPLVSLIIPTRDKLPLLRNCLDGLLNRTDYPHLEIIIVDNQSDKQETLDYFKEVVADPRVSVLHYEKPYNFSAINNWAVQKAKGSVVGLINNDVEVIHRGWLKEMVSQALRPEIGGVGAKLYYEDGSLQHAGVVLGLSGTAGHIYKHEARSFPGYFGRAFVTQNFGAVTAACLVLRKDIYLEVDGFNEEIAVAFNDVDFCLRLHRAGYRVLWTPYAELYHLESATRVPDETPERRMAFAREVRIIEDTWGHLLRRDPYYNPNLTLDATDLSLAFPPRQRPPWVR
ncbi:glycosyltransferase family 2 protein [Rhodovibrionaceae bacterium A322]